MDCVISIAEERRMTSIESFNLLTDRKKSGLEGRSFYTSQMRGKRMSRTLMRESVNLADFTLLEFQNKYQMGEHR